MQMRRTENDGEITLRDNHNAVGKLTITNKTEKRNGEKLV